MGSKTQKRMWKLQSLKKTRLSKGQLVTCIKKGSDLNLFMLDSDILYIIDESKEVWFGGSDDSKEQNTENVDVKGQLNSEWIYEVIVSPKMQPKITRISALPYKQGL